MKKWEASFVCTKIKMSEICSEWANIYNIQEDGKDNDGMSTIY